MTASFVPLQATPDQTVTANLGGQNCTIRVYQRRYGMYLDLYVSNMIVRRAMLCLDMVEIVRDAYLGFSGNLYFYDTQGISDPSYTGLGSRFLLIYDTSL